MSPRPPEAAHAARPKVAVDLAVDEDVSGAWDEPLIRELVRAIVSRECSGGGEYTIALHLVGEDTMRALNRQHRGIDAPTDVLSFPLHDTDSIGFVLPPGQPMHFGDVVVSYSRAVEQARDYGHSTEREVAYLVAHGVLHVLGYDHEDEADKTRMRQREEEALRPLGLTR